MNAIAKVPEYELAIKDSKERFEALCGGHINYGDEEIFAMQMLTKNDYVFSVANKNPRSVQLAMINVASTGLTLNPAMGYAYLVPREGAIVLDISYKGLIKIATDTGAIAWARAECVHEADKFTYRGPAAMPEIVADPFKQRGPVVGVYCIAKTSEGDILTEVMDMEAILKIRSKSTAWAKGAAGKKGPWEDFPLEMYRKAVIKRARKTWPYTDKDGRLAKAVEIANQAEGGYVFEGEVVTSGAAASTAEETEEQKLARKKAAHDEALGRNSESIAHIKERIAAEDIAAAVAEWRLLSQDDQRALWVAPTKVPGACFTVAEREALRTAATTAAARQEPVT